MPPPLSPGVASHAPLLRKQAQPEDEPEDDADEAGFRLGPLVTASRLVDQPTLLPQPSA